MDTPSPKIILKYTLNSSSNILCKIRADPPLLNKLWSQNRVQNENDIKNINGQIASLNFV